MNFINKKSGFTIIEVLITIFIIASGFLVLFTVFQLHVLHATQSRNRIVAEIIADSLVEEMRAHYYGQTAPRSWTDPVKIIAVINGFRIDTIYQKQIQYGNGSFTDQNVNQDTDTATITISWVEGTKIYGRGIQRKYVETLQVRRSGL